MIDWLRKLDNRLFSPPHTFQTVLAFVTIRLGLVLNPPLEMMSKPSSSRRLREKRGKKHE